MDRITHKRGYELLHVTNENISSSSSQTSKKCKINNAQKFRWIDYKFDQSLLNESGSLNAYALNKRATRIVVKSGATNKQVVPKRIKSQKNFLLTQPALQKGEIRFIIENPASNFQRQTAPLCFGPVINQIIQYHQIDKTDEILEVLVLKDQTEYTDFLLHVKTYFPKVKTVVVADAEACEKITSQLSIFPRNLGYTLVDPQGRTPIFQAIISGDLECVEALIKSKASLNLEDMHGRTPLCLAFQKCGVWQAIYDFGLDFELPWNTRPMALIDAAYACIESADGISNDPILQKVIDVLKACSSSVDILCALIKGKVDIHTFDNKGESALSHSAYSNNCDLMNYIYSLGVTSLYRDHTILSKTHLIIDPLNPDIPKFLESYTQYEGLDTFAQTKPLVYMLFQLIINRVISNNSHIQNSIRTDLFRNKAIKTKEIVVYPNMKAYAYNNFIKP